MMEPHILRHSFLNQSRGRRLVTGRMTAGRSLTSPAEEEEKDGDVAAEKLGLSLSDKTIAEAILLFSGCVSSSGESWSKSTCSWALSCIYRNSPLTFNFFITFEVQNSWKISRLRRYGTRIQLNRTSSSLLILLTKMASLCQACASSSATPLVLAKRVFSLASSPFIFTSGHKTPRHYSSFRASTSASASASASTSDCVDLKERRSTDLVELEYAELNLKHKISEVSSLDRLISHPFSQL